MARPSGKQRVEIGEDRDPRYTVRFVELGRKFVAELQMGGISQFAELDGDRGVGGEICVPGERRVG